MKPGSRSDLSLDTLAIHAGQPPDPTHGAVMTPIVLSSTFAQSTPGEPVAFDYSRSGNPTRKALETCLAALEGGKHGFAFGSGCAAATTFLATLRTGDHVVSGDDVYGGSYRLLTKVLEPLGITTTFVDLRREGALEGALTPKTKLVWLESPTNPLLKIFDIAGLVRVARAKGIPVLVDNTFATPMLQRPLEFGATAVLHSTTKYLNGHSDVVGGALITNDDALAERLKFLQNAIGAVPSPMDCYLVMRGLKTLPVRMERHVANATELARRLEKARGVRKVIYPGLPSHPEHSLASRQMRGGGGMISLELEGGEPAARAFLSALEIFTLAESLGGVESLAEHPALMTHASIPPEVRRATGIEDSLVRLSVGIEHVEDLYRDLENALRAATEATR